MAHLWRSAGRHLPGQGGGDAAGAARLLPHPRAGAGAVVPGRGRDGRQAADHHSSSEPDLQMDGRKSD